VIAAVWMRSPADAAARLAALREAARAPGGRPAIAGGAEDAGDELPARRGNGDAGGAVAASALEAGAGGASADGPVGTRLRQPEVLGVAVLCAAATIFFGVYPSPLFDLARDAGTALVNLV
jgi:NADH-quinone oxidoreductase subunit N